jgi:L-threonylcarbamoyladenylate synthase
LRIERVRISALQVEPALDGCLTLRGFRDFSKLAHSPLTTHYNQPITLQMSSDFRIHLAVRALHGGGVIAYPTEGVWGLGCDPDNPEAVLRLLALKHRVMAKGLLLVAADIEQFAPYLTSLSHVQQQRLQASWPAPLTWLVPNNGAAADWICGAHASVALRVSAHPLVAALCRAFGGPLVSTSANPSGHPAALSAVRVRRYFGDELDFILKGELGGQRGPTPIRDLITDKFVRGR